MISAKTAKQKVKNNKAAEKARQQKQWDIEKAQRAVDIKKARKETLPSVLLKIEQEIKEAVAKKDDSIYFRFEPWMDANLLCDDIRKELESNGYEVKIDVYTPTEGGDSDNGNYGAWTTGPDVYSFTISWEDEIEDCVVIEEESKCGCPSCDR